MRKKKKKIDDWWATRVCVQQTNASMMFVCLFYSCHIHNQFDHHLHTLEIKSFSSFFHRSRTRRDIYATTTRIRFLSLSLFSYKTSSRSSMLTQVDNRWWSDDGGHWHLLEDHYNTHVKQHAWIHDLLQKSKILFASKFLAFFLLLMMDRLEIITWSECSPLLARQSDLFGQRRLLRCLLDNQRQTSFTDWEREKVIKNEWSSETHYPHADKISFTLSDRFSIRGHVFRRAKALVHRLLPIDRLKCSINRRQWQRNADQSWSKDILSALLSNHSTHRVRPEMNREFSLRTTTEHVWHRRLWSSKSWRCWKDLPDGWWKSDRSSSRRLEWSLRTWRWRTEWQNRSREYLRMLSRCLRRESVRIERTDTDERIDKDAEASSIGRISNRRTDHGRRSSRDSSQWWSDTPKQRTRSTDQRYSSTKSMSSICAEKWEYEEDIPRWEESYRLEILPVSLLGQTSSFTLFDRVNPRCTNVRRTKVKEDMLTSGSITDHFLSWQLRKKFDRQIETVEQGDQ